eukprot:TRINITY_DN15667_c1_g2_i2.p5 TRINITY_DN15667_c1_g2~~TRINITY_DN15667_c1_g2_i2.p5  ORF type:complete len:212 (-),score=-5.33 TRINITY_DN15667_c1_g2_i2:4017-4652(-)
MKNNELIRQNYAKKEFHFCWGGVLYLQALSNYQVKFIDFTATQFKTWKLHSLLFLFPFLVCFLKHCLTFTEIIEEELYYLYIVMHINIVISDVVRLINTNIQIHMSLQLRASSCCFCCYYKGMRECCRCCYCEGRCGGFRDFILVQQKQFLYKSISLQSIKIFFKHVCMSSFDTYVGNDYFCRNDSVMTFDWGQDEQTKLFSEIIIKGKTR